MNNISPKVSVLMSMYKEPEDWLKKSIESILNQSFGDFEFIIICDNPENKSGIALLKEYASKDGRIRILHNDHNLGLIKSLNRGLDVANGKYIARMDADDISRQNRFEIQYKYMEEHPEVVVLGAGINFIGNKRFWRQRPKVQVSDSDIKAQLLFGNCIAHPTVFMKGDIIKEHGIRYDEEAVNCEDLRMWEIMMDFGQLHNLPITLLDYRLSDQQITNSRKNSLLNNSRKIRYRLQQTWLRNNGYEYTIDDIENKSITIVSEIKNGGKIVHTNSFRAFTQFAYMNNPKRKDLMRLLKSFDFIYFAPLNLIRYIRSCF